MTVLIPCVDFVTQQLAVDTFDGVIMKKRFAAVTDSPCVTTVVVVATVIPVEVKR